MRWRQSQRWWWNKGRKGKSLLFLQPSVSCLLWDILRTRPRSTHWGVGLRLRVDPLTIICWEGLADTLHSEMLLYGIGVHIFFPPTMYTPGYEEENKSKPKITLKIEETDDGLTPDLAALALLKGKYSCDLSTESCPYTRVAWPPSRAIFKYFLSSFAVHSSDPANETYF